MSRVRYILLVLLTALALVGCRRRPMEEEYLRVYLDLTIDKNIVNYTVPEGEPSLMRVKWRIYPCTIWTGGYCGL